ncbi:hypothetical protein CCACVL1_16649 [Corchorus capsularis]|uniref:Uncharacterized protein n=1 Tax=Corchorus capsularis TaxID=210143 RepID=A0A1R3HVZ6_COCAP|nr:hypothetical protein CCACVL1_16649 [Corchorus capsularis]
MAIISLKLWALNLKVSHSSQDTTFKGIFGGSHEGLRYDDGTFKLNPSARCRCRCSLGGLTTTLRVTVVPRDLGFDLGVFTKPHMVCNSCDGVAEKKGLKLAIAQARNHELISMAHGVTVGGWHMRIHRLNSAARSESDPD